MVHENADRAHVPGQPQGPERDIEPLWPQDLTDPTAAGPDPDQMPPDTADRVPAPRTAQPPVDLDLPFTLDHPVPGPDGQAANSPPGSETRPGGGSGGMPADGSGPTGEAAATAGSRNESPWAQPPQRFTSSASEAPAEASPSESTGTGPAMAQTEGGATDVGPPPPDARTAPPPSAADPVPPESPAPRLGPFPPAPGVPLRPYGDGTAYPPGPVGYGQPGYPVTSAHPPPAQAGGPTAPPGPYPPAWPQQGAPAPPQPGPPASQQPAPAAYPEAGWTPENGATPTAEDFARRRQARPVDPVATMGVRAVVNRIGLVRLAPGRHEQEVKRDVEMVRRNFGGLRQVTVVNPKGGAGKTVAILLLAMTFGQKRGGYVLAWDNNETQGTLGMRAQQDFHSRTVRDLLRDLAQFQGAHGRVGDLSQYVRSQGEGMFDVLASDESATGGEMLTAAAFAELRDVVSRFYKLIFVDTGNNVRAQNWQAAMDATDQLVVTMSARNDSAETAARMLDHLEQSGRQRLVRQTVTVVSMPPSRKELDLPAIQAHFAARTRAVLLAPYERLIDTGEPIRYGQLSSATRDAWLKIAAAVAEGL
ncbi:chromosome partitioning protein [Micromonospora sp. SL1-18]|uniref:MinD/ParA family ATP-binding protein n=1 Tax=Micromonospora sp. SL1-18 TaxID=3399128 RepID=UPI003A4D4486